MCHFDIIFSNQGINFIYTECSQVILKCIKQKLANTLILVIMINADAIQCCFP